ncbi:septum formation initiator family protein [Streptomyces sp. NPDC056943]|uniref:FtsB family cell division protein n=1 Tax=Streptomyces sp. NPDC056943 TaxID=3345971 RepID=UPI00364342C2
MSTAKGPLKGRAARLGRLMPSGPSSAARTPFVLLVFVLLGGGLIALLLLNSALNQGSFKLRELKDRTTELTDEEQALQRDVDDYAAPDALERRARELGMVPGGSPAFLGPDGKVLGDPSVAVAPKPDPTPSAKPTPPVSSKPQPNTATATSPTGGSPTGTARANTGQGSTGTTPTGGSPTGPGTTGAGPGRTAPAPPPTATTPASTPTSGR